MNPEINKNPEELIILEDSGLDIGSATVQQSFFKYIGMKISQLSKIKLKDKVIFYRLLATMVNAGITVHRAITILHWQEKVKPVRKSLDKILHALKSGYNLSTALSGQPRNFGNAEVAMVEAGEKSGELNRALLQVATQIEKLSSINRKLMGALMYPAFILIVMAGVIITLMVVVVPKLVEIFGDFSKLPTATQILIRISEFMQNFWVLFIIFPFFVSFVIGVVVRHPIGRYHIDNLKLKIPVFGKLIRKVILSKFSRMLSQLLSSGISITDSLKIISEAVGNEVYKQRIMLLRDDVQRGVKIGESLEGDRLFPEMLIQMIKTGEETARLDSIIIKISEFYDEEVDITVSSMNKILEPIIIVVMAVFVAGIAYGVMTPIFQLSDVVTGTM